jgi:hypothetical protein
MIYNGGVIDTWQAQSPPSTESISWVDRAYCWHVKRVVIPAPKASLVGIHPIGCSAPFRANWYPRGYANNTNPTGLLAKAVLPHLTWKDLEKSIVNPEDLNLLTSLAEIGELKGLIPGLLDSLKLLGKGSHKGLSGLHLGNIFGVSPILDDLKGVYNTAQNLDNHLKNLYDRSGKWTSFGVKRSGTINFTQVFNQGGLVIEKKVHGTFKSYITGEYTYELPFNWYNAGASFLDAYGLRLDASDVWALVPLSFAVDWLVNIGGILDRLDMTAITQTFNVLDVYKSRKVECVETNTLLYEDPKYWCSGAEGVELDSSRWSVYHKTTHILPLFGEWKGSGLDQSKAVTAAALASQFSK